MNRPVLLLGMIVLAVISVTHISGPKVHPPIQESAVYDRITSFEDQHPDWRVLEEDRVDLAEIRFGHQEHMDPDRSQMQMKLEAWVKALRESGVPNNQIPVRRLQDGRLSLTCASCHVTDQAGRYMQPIVFENHCIQCHSLQEQQGEPVPHGREIGTFIDQLALRGAMEPPKKPAVGRPGGPRRGGPPGAAGPPASGPRKPSGPPRSGPPSSGPPSSSAGSADDAPSLEDFYAKLKGDVESNRERLTRTVKATCARCHGNQNPPAQIPDPQIPDRWLTRSTFDHSSHVMVRCDSCHTQAVGSPDQEVVYPGEDDPDHPASINKWAGRTRDIMMPDIQTCRTCHSSQGGAPTHCVVCHSYHPETAAHEGGAFRSELNMLSLEEYAKLGKRDYKQQADQPEADAEDDDAAADGQAE